MAFLSVDDAEPEKVPTAEEARAEIEDWKRRLADLFGMIRDAAKGLDGWTVDDTRTSVINERIMQLRGIPAYLAVRSSCKPTVPGPDPAPERGGLMGGAACLGYPR